ncbi:unnamed protein product [Rotaria magnacalcarata]|uniref:Endonuclease/exonuclease/phosphatase domain-containing protein n=2 Tax=Rotaria magnacalcarata TaxID=392030 RepID=A0A820MJK7_9BILA|nr:unnamed protein product [Rotaria magnacalcarata]CAF4376382.1 unnamed protein product [Rotaria magnacalcarata]CAF5085844.1 unnamed protein product [Rotaria magnacalcarata]
MRLIASYSERRMDIHGLSEQIRIIMKGTILTGDFNATSDEWGSQSTDRRGTSIMSDEQEITKELYNYFKDLAKAPEIDPLNPHDIQIKTEFREL